MKPWRFAVAFLGLTGCIDFDEARSAYCFKRPDVCEGPAAERLGHVFSTALGGSMTEGVNAIAVASDQDSYVAGWYTDVSPQFQLPAGSNLRAAQMSEGYVVKLGLQGQPIRAWAFGGGGDDAVTDVAVMDSSIIAIGWTKGGGMHDYGGASVTFPETLHRSFLTAFDPATGAPRFNPPVTLGPTPGTAASGDRFVQANGVAVVSSTRAVIVGEYRGDTEFGSSSGDRSAFLRLYEFTSGGGWPSWITTQSMSCPSGAMAFVDVTYSLATAEIWVAGTFQGSCALYDAMTGVNVALNSSSTQAFFTVYNTEGRLKAGGALPGVVGETGPSDRSLALTVQGAAVWLVGLAGGGPVVAGNQHIGQGPGLALLQLTAGGASQGMVVPGAIRPRAIASSQGDVWVTGDFDGDVVFSPDRRLRSNGVRDIFLAQLRVSPGAPSHVFSTSFGGLKEDRGAALAIESSGRVTFSGTFGSALQFGEGPQLASSGDSEIFVVRFQR